MGMGIVLTVFVILVALSVSYSVHKRAETARFDRLQGLIYGILGATDISRDASLVVNMMALPDQRLNQNITGLYAELVSSDGTRLWQSASTSSWLPNTSIRPIGDWLFETVGGGSKPTLHRLQLATAWEFDNGEELPFIVHVVDEADSLTGQLKRFDQTLWATLLLSAAGLLVVQLIVLKYSLKPLHNIGEEVALIEKGELDALNDDVPAELKSTTLGLNALLRAERARHAQYRYLLDDLAHSLKTPLSVLQNLDTLDSDEHRTIVEQTAMMRQSIDRHTQRATIRSPRYLARAISVTPIVVRIADSLTKLYGHNGLGFTIDVDPSVTVRMDEADLFEVLGNILENACKYGATNIHISHDSSNHRLVIEDDGRGFPDIDLDQLIQRGVRADSQTTGSGLGLAATQHLLEGYGGQIIPSHAAGGGARIELEFGQ